MPNTWKAISREIEGEVIPQTKINENYIATMKIQKLLDEGHSEKEIALIWNGTLAGSEKPIEKKGVNKLGIKYDTKQYSLKVMKVYAEQ